MRAFLYLNTMQASKFASGNNSPHCHNLKAIAHAIKVATNANDFIVNP